MGLDLYLNAFYDLDNDRSYKDGVEPIKRSDIKQYARDCELSEEQTDDLLFYIFEMDKAHRARVKSKQPKPPEHKGKRGRK